MELRILRYFLAVVKKGNIIGAAESLHVTQPTLSRQLIELEDGLGKKLFIRGSRKITLTDEGILLYKRAEEIIELVEKTKSEIAVSDKLINGDIYIGGGETEVMRLLAQTIKKLQQNYPNIKYHIFSGNADDVMEKLDRGLLDFGVLIEPANITKYEYIKLPATDIWGVLMKKDSPLAQYKTIKPEHLRNIPILCSRQSMVGKEITEWVGKKIEKLNVIATYNLLYNASLMVEEGIGYALCIDKLINTTVNESLCFRPLEPKLEVGLNIIWKKSQVFSKAANKFLETLKVELEEYKN